MIQPVSAFSPRAVFRGSSGTYERNAFKTPVNSRIALANAGGVAAGAGALTAMITRGYTSSWSHAIVLGLSGAFLTMFFMTPHLIDKLGVGLFSSKKSDAEVVVKEDAPKFLDAVKEHFKPMRKPVPFKQS